MRHFLAYWYAQSPARFLEAAKHGIGTLDGQFAVQDTLRNLNKPLFQDYTYQGRILGVVFRIGRVGLALVIYTVAAAAYLAAFILWLLFPFLCIISIVGSVAA
jgi:hypothetical protein